jgi:hypothetical protein
MLNLYNRNYINNPKRIPVKEIVRQERREMSKVKSLKALGAAPRIHMRN